MALTLSSSDCETIIHEYTVQVPEMPLSLPSYTPHMSRLVGKDLDAPAIQAKPRHRQLIPCFPTKMSTEVQLLKRRKRVDRSKAACAANKTVYRRRLQPNRANRRTVLLCQRLHEGWNVERILELEGVDAVEDGRRLGHDLATGTEECEFWLVFGT